MSPEELLRLENIFIKLKNDELPTEDIYKQFPGVDRFILEKWNRDFTEADKGPKGPQIWSIITGKSPDGKYIYSQSLSFNTSPLEKAKFDLWRVATQKIEKFADSTEEQIESYKNLISESAKAHQIFSRYVTHLNIERKENDEYAISFNLNTEDESIFRQVNDAVRFYAHNFVSSSLRLSSLRTLESRTKDVYKSASDIMPFALKGFRIVGYKGIIDTEIKDIPIDTKWVFITGENSYGKTSVLQAITIGLYGIRDNDKLLVILNETDGRSDPKIGVEFRANNQNIVNNIYESNFSSLKNLACYGPSRLQVQSSQTKNEVSSNSSVTYSMFNPDGILFNIEYNLLIWYLEKNQRFESVKRLFKKMIPYLSDITIVNNDVLYIEKEPDENGKEYLPLTFENLASGVRSIIAMIGDMIIRLFNSQPHIINPSELEGIVIIDELDLHWHPKLQRELPNTLSNIFPYIQFVATTHSVIPFLGAPENSIFLKIKRSKEEGIKVERVNIDITNLLPNILLTSSLFDMDNITQINNNDLSKVRTEDSESEMISNDERLRRIREFQESNRNFPDDLFK